ncbi:MAG: tripartite tricarboxylate transporter substrate binding protein [Sedimentibacter sp.]|uniref:Bug family tripartite tricarboxylate transporter substrate binding protein n=1 Tax=Sedimentibacter sp. TaxID=1960295 RepID=UPI00315859F7
MKKRFLLTVMALVLSLSIMGCSKKEAAPSNDPAAPQAWKFERPIEIVIPFGPGSGTDTTIRAWAPLMEKELGTTININNVAGAGGVQGAEFFVNQPADGYTFAMYTPSHIIAAVDGTASFDILNDTMQVVRLVQDSNIILAGKNVPYNNLEELIAYAKANPGKKPTLGMMSINGIDGAAAQQLFDEAGIEVQFIPYASGAEANAAIMGGHTDMVLTSPFDGNAYLKSGDMKAIVLLAEERATNLPDVQCTGELGIEAYIGPWRGIVAAKGTPQEAIDALEAAAVKVNEMQEWNDWKASVGLNDRPGFATQEEFKTLWFEYYETMKELRGK